MLGILFWLQVFLSSWSSSFLVCGVKSGNVRLWTFLTIFASVAKCACGLWPKWAVLIFWSGPKLFGVWPTFWHANAPVPTLAHFSSQCWPIHWQANLQPILCLANFLAWQLAAQTKHTLNVSCPALGFCVVNLYKLWIIICLEDKDWLHESNVIRFV